MAAFAADQAEAQSSAEIAVRQGIGDLAAGGARADAWRELQVERIRAWCSQRSPEPDACTAHMTAALSDYIAVVGIRSDDAAVQCQMLNIPVWRRVIDCLNQGG